jgi:hypothetical protein
LAQANRTRRARRAAGLLKTGGVTTLGYALENQSRMLFTQNDGKMVDVMDFMLEQPEVTKFTWNSQDYFPKRLAAEAKRAAKAAAHTKKGSKREL